MGERIDKKEKGSILKEKKRRGGVFTNRGKLNNNVVGWKLKAISQSFSQ